jgi:hypothetical protein
MYKSHMSELLDSVGMPFTSGTQGLPQVRKIAVRRIDLQVDPSAIEAGGRSGPPSLNRQALGRGARSSRVTTASGSGTNRRIVTWEAIRADITGSQLDRISSRRGPTGPGKNRVSWSRL